MPRRRFLGLLVAAPTLAAAARLGLAGPASAVTPGSEGIGPSVEPADDYDLGDLLNEAAAPTSQLITVVVGTDGTISFALPRAEVGQGITTAIAMCIADEMDLRLDQVRITLADARPELVWNQLTGGSNTMHSMFTPVRVAAALAKQALLDVAAIELQSAVGQLQNREGVITAPSGASVTYGQLATKAAVPTTRTASVELKAPGSFSVIGTPQSRIDALDAVTGRKVFAMDVDVPGALPTMVCRPPTINGTVVAVRNAAAVLALPGVTDVAAIPTGVAVRAATFGQCIDAVDALDVVWGPGTEDAKSDADVEAELVANELPLAPAPPVTQVIDKRFTFCFVSNSPLETNSAVARVTETSAEIWSSLKSPITAQQDIALALGLPPTAVTCHVVQGGGSFGRHLFWDAAKEAALASKAFGYKPVRLMWHRTDDFRQGRAHPMATSRVRVQIANGEVVNLEQRHTSVSTDYSHGLGEILSAYATKVPGVNFLAYTSGLFYLTQTVPYRFVSTDQAINEIDTGFNTGSMRNVYSPDVCTAMELVVDQAAAALGQDPYDFRLGYAKDARTQAVLERVAAAGQWGRPLPAGVAQGIAVHSEYKGRCAVLAEIDTRPETVDRKIRDAYTGPRVTRVVLAVDVGLPINPRGLEAQMQGGIMDGIAKALTFSLHLQKGTFLEGSWDNAYYTRQWNVPPEVQVIVMPPTTSEPGGAGEFAVGPTMAAVACAYARATGTVPTKFPVNHDQPLGFAVIPTEPPLPESPTDVRPSGA
ncbi:MAG TPA: molybdopterin cofactor-binding domain-containing protein [Acidimicrobiales bacterium]|nr:molybdopterin cofactor-binding domain-containing protein [Acidimicrobiales bacterium]